MAISGGGCQTARNAALGRPESEVQAIVISPRHSSAEIAVRGKPQAEELATSNLRLEEFAYTAAHDLREPLRAIALYTTLLAKRMDLDSKDKTITGFISDGAACMAVLVDDLLSFATTGMQEPTLRMKLAGAVTSHAEPGVGD